MGAHRALRATLLTVGILGPALAFAQTPAAAIEGFSGILFFCKPVANQAWTQRLCEEASTEMTGWASRSKKPMVLLKSSDTRETNHEKARAAGFDARNGLWVLLTVAPRNNPAGWDLNARADGISLRQPVPAAPQTTTYTKSEILGSDIPADEAAARGRRILGSIMTVLTLVMQPL